MKNTTKKVLSVAVAMGMALSLGFTVVGCGGGHTHVDANNDGICDECHEDLSVGEHEHNFGEWKTETPSTCWEKGVESRKCTVCKKEETRSLALADHSFDSTYTVDTPATYEKAGSESRHCKNFEHCGGKTDSRTIPQLDATKEITYTFSAYRNNGTLIPNVWFDIYLNGELVQRAKEPTGTTTLSLLPKTYTVEVTGLPEGYTINEKSYTVEPMNPTLDAYATASLRTGTPSNTAKYKDGDVLYNQSFTWLKNEIGTSLSDVLSKYKLVMFSFFYVGCQYCEEEIPDILAAHKGYEQDVAIIFINRYENSGADTNAKILEWVDKYGISTYPVARDPVLFNRFPANNSVPYNVFVDKEGVVVESHLGAILGLSGFREIFSKYTKGTAAVSANLAAQPVAALPAKREED